MGAEQLFPVLVFAGLVVATAAGIIAFSSLFGPTRKKSKEKFDTYECGVQLLDSARRRFSSKYYLTALVFLLFDIEAVFLIPWAVIYRKLGVMGLFETFFFIAVLGLGLLYIYRRGALEWE